MKSQHTSPPDTTFLVGAGRSGTTLLYKILCLHPDVAYISNFHNRMPWLRGDLISWLAQRNSETKLRAWFKHGGNAYFVNRPLAKRLVPTPVEGESLLAACGLPLFPSANERLTVAAAERLRLTFKRIIQGAGARTLVCKRTANNRRIPLLDSALPTARYIQLIRDGRDVAHSLSKVEWWEGHTLWWDGRTAAELENTGEPRLRICARNWAREIEQLEGALKSIPEGRRMEIRYELLLKNPTEQVARVLDFIGLPFTVEYRKAVESLKLKSQPHKWRKQWTADDLSNVMSEAEPLLSQLGYH